MSKEVKYSKFYNAVEDSKGWWKEYPYITSKEVKYSGFCGAVKDSRG